MSFFTTSDGQQIESSKEFDGGGGEIELIPNNTSLLAAILEAKWAQFEGGDAYINVKWQVMLPTAYKGRIVFQKLKVCDAIPKVRDKAKSMLVAIDTNCGAKLIKAGVEPTDDTLGAAWQMGNMMIQCMVWEIKTEKDKETGDEYELPEDQWKSGNWIRAVNDAKTGKEIIAARELLDKQQSSAAPAVNQSRPAPQRQAAPAPAAQSRPAPTAAAPRQQARPGVATQAVSAVVADVAGDITAGVKGGDPAPDFESFDDDIPF